MLEYTLVLARAQFLPSRHELLFYFISEAPLILAKFLFVRLNLSI